MIRCIICMKPLPKGIFNPIGLCEICIGEEDVKRNTYQTKPQRQVRSVGQETRNVDVRSDKGRKKKQISKRKKNGNVRSQRKKVEALKENNS